MAFVFLDLKKIVALSTCNKVSWCLVYFLCGDLALALAQLLTHGVSKCYLFMAVGDVMRASSGAQNSLAVYSPAYGGKWLVSVLAVLVFSLCGLPFIGIFFSKHSLFSGFIPRFGIGGLILVLFGFFISYSYSVRLCFMFCSMRGGLSTGHRRFFHVVGGLCLVGSLFNVVGLCAMEETGSVSVGWSFLFLLLQVFGCFLGACLYCGLVSITSRWWSLVCGGEALVGLFYQWFNRVMVVFGCAVYRWESYFGGLLYSGRSKMLASISVIFSLNYLVLAMFYGLVVMFIFS